MTTRIVLPDDPYPYNSYQETNWVNHMLRQPVLWIAVLTLLLSMSPTALATAVLQDKEAVPSAADPAQTLVTVCGVRVNDEIVLISSRPVGCSCDAQTLQSGLRCQRCVVTKESSQRHWYDVDLLEILHQNNSSVPTVVFVHGNQISAGQDKRQGLVVYRRMMSCADQNRPIRFIIFSWPSAKISGPLRDIRVKAARTRPVGCQLAWVLDQIPGDVQLGLIGYSYGARVITGALHLLGGAIPGAVLVGQGTGTGEVDL